VGATFGRPNEPRDMGEGLLLLPELMFRGMFCCIRLFCIRLGWICWVGEPDLATQSPMKGPPKGSFDEEELGRDDDEGIML
jgi:hypothetical protein